MMTSISNDEIVQIVKYLMGNLSEDENEELNEKIFIENEFFEKIEYIRETLINNYVSRSLTQSEAQQFEEKFLIIPDNFRAVEEAKIRRQELKKLFPEQPAAPSAVGSWIWAQSPYLAAMCLLVIASLGLAIFFNFPPREIGHSGVKTPDTPLESENRHSDSGKLPSKESIALVNTHEPKAPSLGNPNSGKPSDKNGGLINTGTRSANTHLPKNPALNTDLYEVKFTETKAGPNEDKSKVSAEANLFSKNPFLRIKITNITNTFPLKSIKECTVLDSESNTIVTGKFPFKNDCRIYEKNKNLNIEIPIKKLRNGTNFTLIIKKESGAKGVKIIKR